MHTADVVFPSSGTEFPAVEVAGDFWLEPVVKGIDALMYPLGFKGSGEVVGKPVDEPGPEGFVLQ